MNYLLSLSILCITSCLSAQTFEWAKNYDYGAQDYGTSIGTDKYGNVYIKGKSFNITGGSGGYSYSMLWKLDISGNVLWTDTLNLGGKAAIDSNGNIYIASGIVAKYNSEGQQLWTAPTPIPTGVFHDIVLHPSGGIIGVGNALISDTTKSVLSRYDENGNCLWTRIGDFPSGGSTPNAISCDIAGNTYWVGQNLINDSIVGFLAKIDNTGNLLSTYIIPNEPTDIVIASDFSIYALGRFLINSITLNGEAHYETDGLKFLVKYDQQGNLLWYKIIGGSIGNYYVATDNSDNLYITISHSSLTIDSIVLDPEYSNLLVMKIDGSGDIVWYHVEDATQPGVYGSSIYPGDICVNAQNEVFITGAMVGTHTFGSHTMSLPTGYTDLFAIKISQQDITASLTKPTKNTSSLSVFPNPGNGLFTINFIPENMRSTYTYNVINIVGQIVYTETVGKTAVYSKQLDLSHLTKGTYYINLYTSNTNSTTDKKQLKESLKIFLQ